MLEVGLGESRRDHIPALDGLRGVACLLVVAGHLGFVTTLPVAHLDGVEVFFVLSGFLITRILLHNADRGIPLRHFLIRRAFRIFPIYYLVVGVAAIVGTGAIWTAATYVYNFTPERTLHWSLGHTWSLCVEEHFYLVWPFAVMMLGAVRSRAWAVRALVWSMVASLALELAGPQLGLGNRTSELLYRATPFRAVALVAGCLLAFGEARWRGHHGFGLAGLACVVASSLAITYMPLFALHLTAERGLSTLMASGLLVAATGVLAAVFALAPLRWLGRISYGIYLYHMPMIALFGGYGWHIVALTTLAVSAVSYLVYERPMMRLGARLSTQSADHSTPLVSLDAEHARGQSLPGLATAATTEAAR